MNEDIAWIPILAQNYLSIILHQNMKVFEYGSGKSTMYFNRCASYVVSVEHDPEWYYQISLQLGNINFQLILPEDIAIGNDPSNPSHYASNSIDGNFKQYVSSIDIYGSFDIIFIDGRSRTSCLKHAIKKVKNGGWIILDDADREYYLTNTRYLFEGWETVLFSGCSKIPWKTLFIRKPLE